MAGISDKAIKTQYAENKYRFNDGTELQNKEFSDGSGLEFYETGYRSYDPQLGRFWQIDAIGEASPNWSPYTYAVDNPVFFNDPLGLDTTTYDPVVVSPNSNKPVQIAFVPGTGSPTSPTIDFGPPPDEVPDIPISSPSPSPSTEPTVVPLGGPGILGTAALTITATVWPKSMGQEGIPEPNPLFSRFTPDSKRDQDDKITLYRGVHPDNPNFKYALEGMAVPRFGDDPHNDPKRHNDGDVGSIFTSWTTRPSVAVEKAGRYGVVLVKQFHIGQTVPSPDKHNEQEVLVPGIVTGAAVFPAFTSRRL